MLTVIIQTRKAVVEKEPIVWRLE